MPVYNCVGYINEAVVSILNQTFTYFELLIIDDASNDGTYELLQNINDDRICLMRKHKNSGYVESLNWGLSLAKGTYIARMDGDDISLPTRFEHQLKILDSDKRIGLCGTNYMTMDEYGNVNEQKAWPKISTPVFWQLLWQNPIAHPSVMIRAEVLRQYKFIYDRDKHPAEDYDLWCRLSLYTKFYRIEEALLIYRVHSNSEYNRNKEAAFKNGLFSLQELGKQLTGAPFPDMHIQQTIFKVLYKENEVSDPKAYHEWLKKLIALLLQRGHIEEKDLSPIHEEVMIKYNEQIKTYWYGVSKLSLKKLIEFYCSPAHYFLKFSIKFQFRFVIKCLTAYSSKAV